MAPVVNASMQSENVVYSPLNKDKRWLQLAGEMCRSGTTSHAWPWACQLSHRTPRGNDHQHSSGASAQRLGGQTSRRVEQEALTENYSAVATCEPLSRLKHLEFPNEGRKGSKVLLISCRKECKSCWGVPPKRFLRPEAQFLASWANSVHSSTC